MKKLILLIMPAVLLSSCGKGVGKTTVNSDTESPDSMAIGYYKLRTEGRFTEYVSAMQSCDGTTQEYKKRVENMIRQHQNEIEREKKGISHVESLRSELHNDGKMANVFLRVTYNDGACEEIVFPLVKDEDKWRIQ